MNNPNLIKLEQLPDLLLTNTPLIDVRAPVEFVKGSIPGSINLPILNDDERAQIGTMYKTEGQDAAVALGHRLVSGSNKQEKINHWIQFIKSNPNCVIYCFRGGMRSQITQQWLKELGYDRPIIHGGYKAVRNYLSTQTEDFAVKNNFLTLTGPTGSGKTNLLHEISNQFAMIDLENIAQHRGSAFGSTTKPQPSQIDFENKLSVNIMQLNSNKILNKKTVFIEDESALIGRCMVPKTLYDKYREAPVLWLDEPIENRVQNIFAEYILQTEIGSAVSDVNKTELAQNVFKKYYKAVNAISKKLGGLRSNEITQLIENSEKEFLETKNLTSNCLWIEKLLSYYYDPIYLDNLERRKVKISFRGNYKNCVDFIHKNCN